MIKKRKLSINERKLIADFLANIGVAWFAAGVIGVFITRPKNIIDITLQIFWGIAFSGGFLRLGLFSLKHAE